MKLSEADARARLSSARVARLATVDAEGAPHLVPIVFAVEDDLIFTAVDHKPKASQRLRRLANIAQNPRVALLADAYGDDWDAIWWARVDGRASIIADAGELRHPLDLLVARYAQYRERRPLGPVIAIRAERWSGWAAS